MNQWELRDLTHEFPEWEDPRGSSRPIERYTLFRALGMTHVQAQLLVESCEEFVDMLAYWAEVEERARQRG